jgi:hypothetical protein
LEVGGGPGPGAYKFTSDWSKKNARVGVMKQSGKKVTNHKFLSGETSMFKSATERTPQKANKRDTTSPMNFEPLPVFGLDRIVECGGGAPNNFTNQIKDEPKFNAPFGSTVSKETSLNLNSKNTILI